MKNLSKLAVSVIGCELVGLLGAVFTISSIPTWYSSLNKPLFSPPNWIFGPTWTFLYLIMGISFYLIWQLGWKKKNVRIAGLYFLAQLGLNFIWSPIFFGLKSPLMALVIIIAMFIVIIITIRKFYKLSKLAAYLLIPYLLWVSFATLLNFFIVILN